MAGSLLELIEELQQVHGLRTDDYVRYRRYCSRKLERLRNKFNLHHTAKSQVKVSLELCKSNPEALHLILFKLEWFWAQINHLRNELSRNSRKKQHIRSICKNSLKFIDQLTQLSQDGSISISFNLRLEYLAYINSFEGIVRNELKEFSLAFNCLQLSKLAIEELIQREAYVGGDHLFEKKLSELETIMRVCQYSADMHDSVIEFDEESLNSYKMNFLTDKMSKSEIINAQDNDSNDNKVLNLNFGPHNFIAKGDVTLFEKDLKKNLKVSRKLFSNEPNVNRETALQVAFYENIYYQKEIGHKLINFAYKGFKSVDFKICLEKLIQSKGYKVADECFTKSMDLLANLLINLFSIQKSEPTENVSSFVNTAISVIDMIKAESEMIEKYNFCFLKSILKYENEIKKRLMNEINRKSQKSINFPSVPVPPKPSFYDIVLESLYYSEVSSQTEAKTGGISNLFSNLWGNKK